MTLTPEIDEEISLIRHYLTQIETKAAEGQLASVSTIAVSVASTARRLERDTEKLRSETMKAKQAALSLRTPRGQR